MNQSIPLLWKEWREARAYLWIGLGIFLGLPLVGGLEVWVGTRHNFYIEAIPWVGCFGGVLAVFTAVGITCRDLSGRIEDFWRSVPVSVARWWSIKYVVGLTIALAACAIPLLVEAWKTPHRDPLDFLGCFLLFLTAVYSLAFAAGCLLRRTAHAAMVGLAGMLLMWFLPLVLPPLAFLSFMDLDGVMYGEWWVSLHTGFTAGMLGLAAVGVLLAIVAVRRSWHIVSGRRMIYVSISATFLILCASASFQLGANLPILQEFQIPAGELVGLVRMHGSSGEIRTGKGYPGYTIWFNRKIQITASGFTLGEPIIADDPWFEVSHDATLPDGSYVRYGAETGDNQSTGPLKLFMWHFRHDGEKPSEQIAPIQLWNQGGNSESVQYVWKDRLYLIGATWRRPDVSPTYSLSATRLAILDISDPLKPKILSNTPFDYLFRRFSYRVSEEAPADNLIVNLPPVPGLPARERLKFALPGSVMEGDTFCSQVGDAIIEYHLETLSDGAAAFTKIAIAKPSIIQTLFHGVNWSNLQLQDGLLYEMQGYGAGLPPCVNIFDTRGPHPMRMVGHFAAPDARVVCPLPDGRALVGGDKLWLVGPPPNVPR